MADHRELTESPPTLYLGCGVYTVDNARPRADAVAVEGDRIAAVGGVEECRAALGEVHEEVDLGGGTLLPGFIDTHVHPVMLAYFNMNARLSGARSIADVQDLLREAAAARPGAWVTGLDFDDQKLGERRMPTRHELDEAAGDVPAVVIRCDGHMLIANTRAIEAAGITAGTPDPAGGFIDREPDGFPAGPFREAAAQVVLSAAPFPDVELFKQSALSMFDELAARGITSVGSVLQTDAEGPAGAQGSLDLLAMQLVLGGIPQSIFSMLIARDFAKIEAARDTALEQNQPGGHRVGAMKLFADGSLGSSTAYMSAPFSDAPSNRGFMIYDDAELYRRMVAAHVAGLQIAAHAIGDAAIRRVLDLYEKLLGEYPREDARHRIEHASVLDPTIVDDMARLGVVAAVTPLYIDSEKGWLAGRVGEERARWTYPFRSMLDAGVRVAGSSDAPVESTDVLSAIQCCVTREGFETRQGISAVEAVRMYTLDAAFAQHEEGVKGSITPGKRADMVLLDADPTAVSPGRISGIKVKRTIAGGVTCFEAGADSGRD
ncbi:MAG: amidohydrolase [Candidatus Geothermincolia bacterium]